MILLAKHWGYNATVNKDEQNRIATAAIHTVAYDCGLKKVPKGSMWKEWLKQFEAAVEGQENGMAILLDNKKMGPKHGKYTEWIKAAYPGYLHDVYRCALKAVSVEATWSEIALAMNADSTRINDKPNLEMSRWKVYDWFKANNGKVKKRISRPILTPERMIKRVNWCTERKRQIASDAPFYAAFLDEKWFYMTCRRKKAKW